MFPCGGQIIGIVDKTGVLKDIFLFSEINSSGNKVMTWHSQLLIMSWISHSEVRALALASIGKVDKHWKQEKKNMKTQKEEFKWKDHKRIADMILKYELN